MLNLQLQGDEADLVVAGQLLAEVLLRRPVLQLEHGLALVVLLIRLEEVNLLHVT